MDSSYFTSLDGLSQNSIDSPLSPGGDAASPRRANALSSKISAVLSSSYTDPEIREGLRLVDLRKLEDEEARRNLKADAQKEVIDANASIIGDFGAVSEVSIIPSS